MWLCTCLSETQIRVEEKKSIEKNSLLLFFRTSHTQKLGHCYYSCCCWLVCVASNILWGCSTVSSIDGLRKMNKESGNELLIKLSNSKEGKDRTLFYYYHADRVILKNNFWNVFYYIAVLQSNIWNIRLTLEQQTGKGQERALSKDKYHHLSWEHLWKGQKQTNCFSS